MPRSFAYIVAISLLLTATDANAASCDEIANDKSRLACYDSAALCQSERSDVMRLACFDRAFGQAQPTLQTQSSVVSPVKGPIPAAPNVTVISPGATAEEKVVKRPQIVSAQPVISDGAEPTVNESEFGLPDLRSSVKAKFMKQRSFAYKRMLIGSIISSLITVRFGERLKMAGSGSRRGRKFVSNWVY